MRLTVDCFFGSGGVDNRYRVQAGHQQQRIKHASPERFFRHAGTLLQLAGVLLKVLLEPVQVTPRTFRKH